MKLFYYQDRTNTKVCLPFLNNTVRSLSSITLIKKIENNDSYVHHPFFQECLQKHIHFFPLIIKQAYITWRLIFFSMIGLYCTRGVTIQNFFHDTYCGILDKWYLCVSRHFSFLRICHIRPWKLKLIFEKKTHNIYVSKQIMI